MPRYTLYDLPWYRMVSPGDSSVPASTEPAITESAPAAIALAMSPLYLMPPSAITGTSFLTQVSTTPSTAVSCGTPTPETILVVQMDPGPIPTFTASAPASMSISAAAPVAMLPAIIWAPSAACSRISLTVLMTPWEWPWAVSTTTASAPASYSARARATPLSPVPVAAATLSLPCESLHDFGLSRLCWMSRTVIMPAQPPSSSTTISFSMRFWWRSFLATSGSTCSGTVTTSVVIIVETFTESSETNLMSRLVMIPARVPESSTTGNPEKPCCDLIALSSPMVLSGEIVTGSRTRPASKRLTR